MDERKAKDLVLQAQRVLLENAQFGNIILYNYIGRSANWNYYKANLKTQPSAGKPAAGFNIWSGHLLPRNTWLDTKDPSYQGRPPASL